MQSSIRAKSNSGAIHRVDPPKNEVQTVALSVVTSSMTFESPKSVMMAFPFLSTRIFPYKTKIRNTTHMCRWMTYAFEVAMDYVDVMEISNPRCSLGKLAGDRHKKCQAWHGVNNLSIPALDGLHLGCSSNTEKQSHSHTIEKPFRRCVQIERSQRAD